MPKIRTSRRAAAPAGDGLEALSREQLLERAYAADILGVPAGWKTSTIIRKLRELKNGTKK